MEGHIHLHHDYNAVMLRRLLGPHLDHWTPQAAEVLRLGKPTHVLLTEGAVEGVNKVIAICGPGVRGVLRDTYADMGGDQWMNAFIQRDPAHAGLWAANRLLAMAYDNVDRDLLGHITLHSFCMPPVETQEQRQKLNIAEMEFANVCHDAGYPVILINAGEGNLEGEEWEDLRGAVEVADYIGRHLYMVLGEAGRWHEYRYLLDPDWVPRYRMLATECGIEPLGWRRLGLEENEATWLMELVAKEWAKHGILGGIWFAGTTRDPDRWGPYTATMGMWERWGQMPLLEAPQGPRNGPQEPEEDEEGGSMEYRERWSNEYATWRASGGVSDVDFLAWMAATRGHQLTAEEFRLIVRATKGNVEALAQLDSPPKA